jgi:hypothetical protein
MAVSIVEGSLEAFELKRRAPAISLYRDLVIRHRDGGETRFKRAVAAGNVADKLAPGARGRFFLFESIDQKGIHALQLDDGTEVHAFPVMNERIILLVLVLNCVLLIGRMAIDGRLWILPLILILLAAIVYPLYRRTHLEARDQFARESAKAR